MPTPPAGATVTQLHFRGRNDDGSESAATWKAAQDTNWTQATDTNFRARFSITISSNNDSASDTFAGQLQYNLNSAGWNNVTGASSVVRAFSTSNFADDASTTNQLSLVAVTGTFVAGKTDKDDGVVASVTITYDANVPKEDSTEHEYCVQIRGVDVNNNDSIQLRLSDAGVVTGWAFTATPTITVSKTATANALLGRRAKMGCGL